MSLLRNITSGIRSLFRKDQVDRELNEELGAYLEMEAAEKMQQGMSRKEALRAVRLERGHLEVSKEIVRSGAWESFVETCWRDLRFAVRLLGKSPGFSAVAVLTLALGIGANTAIYSLMESILLRSLPVADPESLVVLNWHSRPPQKDSGQWVVHGLQGLFWPGTTGNLVSGIFPYPAFETLREENPVFTTLFGYFNGHNRNLAIRGQAMSAGAEYVTGGYFRGLGVSPAAGRLIESEDDRPGAAPVAVISFATSQNRFGGATNAIGQPVLIDNIPFTVIGVAPPEFFGVDPAAAPDLYLPLHTNVLVEGAAAARLFGGGNLYLIEKMGRLRPPVRMGQAAAAPAPPLPQSVVA